MCDRLSLGAPDPRGIARRASASQIHIDARNSNIVRQNSSPGLQPQSTHAVMVSPGHRHAVMHQQQQQQAGAHGLRQALVRISKSIGLTVEVLAAVGETIGEESAEVRVDMAQACREARAVAAALEKQCEGLRVAAAAVDMHLLGAVRALRFLLAAVTRVLLLADNVVVKQLLLSTSAASHDAKGMRHFTEFVQAFCDLGADMVHFAFLVGSAAASSSGGSSSVATSTAVSVSGAQSVSSSSDARGWREREEQRQAQVDCARVVLVRSSTLLLTAVRTLQSIPDSATARENRDTVFCQMRRGLDLIHFIIKEGVLDCSRRYGLELEAGVMPSGGPEDEDYDGADRNGFNGSTVLKAICQFEDSVEIMRLSLISDSYKEQLVSNLSSIVERTQDFTDSAYTRHENRQRILLHCDRARVELAHLLRNLSGASASESAAAASAGMLAPSLDVDEAMHCLLSTMAELRADLQQATLELTSSLIRNCMQGNEILAELEDAALMSDVERAQVECEHLAEHIDYVEDVCRLVRHATPTEALQVRAKHAQINLRIFGPQVTVAANTLCRDSHSKVARANMEAFSSMWRFLTEEVMQVAKEVQKTLISPMRRRASSIPLASGAGSASGVGVSSSSAPGQLGVMPPVIMEQPPTPTMAAPPSGFPDELGHQHLHPHMGVPRDHHLLGLPTHPDEMMGAGGPHLGKFNKSVPNLSSVVGEGPMGHVGGGGGGGYLGPPVDPAMLEPRRHSTSCVPGQYPTPMGYALQPEHVLLSSYGSDADNEIVKRARKMATLALEMYDFTRGLGKVKTTQDLFTQSEYFAQDSNALYKVIRIFSYDVPAGEDKRSLMAIADHVPKHCQQMQMLIQSPAVGRAATFNKVDSIIKETRAIMQLVVRVVDTCFDNANKYNLDFSAISLEARGVASDDPSQPFGSSSGGSGGAASGGESS